MSDRQVIENSITIDFYKAEAELWRDGGEAAFITMLARTAENKLDAAGALGPYQFSVIRGDGRVSPFVFQAREVY